MKSRPHGGIDKVDLNRSYPFKQIFIDHEGESLFRKKTILVPRFVQNQAQRRSRSASLIQCDPDGRNGYLVLQGILDHLAGLFRNLKHETLLGTKVEWLAPLNSKALSLYNTPVLPALI